MLKPLKWYKKLHTSKGRRQSGSFLAEGPRFISQIIESRPELVEEVLIGLGVDFDTPDSIPTREINDSVVNDLSTDKSSQKVFASVKMPQQFINSEIPNNIGNGILFLEGVQDPGNVGTLIRSAVAFGFSGILMDNNCADPFSPKAIHSSAGSILFPWIVRSENIEEHVSKMRKLGYKLVASDLSGEEDLNFSDIEKIILVMGNEGNGISDEMRENADVLFKIPMNNRAVESLNVGAAGAVAMYMAKRG